MDIASSLISHKELRGALGPDSARKAILIQILEPDFGLSAYDHRA